MHRTLSASLGIAFLAGAAPVADAQTVRQARQEVEASMLVTGHVDIGRDGQAASHVLDQPDKLPPYVVELIARAVPSLRFEPVLVDGAPVIARAKTSVRLVATPAGDGEGNMQLRIASAHFGEEYSETDRTSVRQSNLRPPRYPMNIAQIGGKGTVYLLVKVGRDGKAADVVAERQRQWIAEVTVARPLEAEQQERLALGLRRAFGRDLVMDVTVDPHVVGGIRVQVGDDVVDGSMASRLHDLQRRMAG